MPAMLLQQQQPNNDLHQKQQHEEEEHLERSRSHTSFASPASTTSASMLRKSWPATSQNGLTNHRRSVYYEVTDNEYDHINVCLISHHSVLYFTIPGPALLCPALLDPRQVIVNLS